ncbi:DNA end-binding protein Ku [Pseudarthrobacter defluvii]|uniref:non-homologous end joining protein Ku n=1 Tax=Pseudarthrobacter defluvii TaxID=410837 RepID=UPI002785B6E4|nr:Ku protein [Pseudarthrobacter defluvii]MDQ0770889.1 DNA end-binding protein Ku [Pseudarthrobacter defluvii]
MRAIWKGAIAFGLVNVPVKVYSATEDHDISLHQVHNADGGRIRYQRRCEICGEVVDYSDIEKAFDEDGRTVVLSKDELKSIPAENSHEIEVVQFVPSEQLEPMMFEKSYYLEPDSKSPKAYVLLRRALEDTDRVAIVQFALREKTRLGALRIKDDVLVLQSLLWPDEVREANFPSLEADVRISAQERDMSAALVESMAADFEPESFTDEYQVQLRQLIDAKLEQGESLDTEETFGVEAGEGGKGEVIDLMEALKRSLDRKRGGGEAATASGDSDDEADTGDEEAEPAKPARKSTGARSSSAGAASKTAAKTGTDDAKPAAKSTASKTTAAKSTTAKSTASKTTASKSTGTKTAAKPAAKTTRARKPA